jgi:formylglycine-generating enzyme required for sulfatase activity
MPRKYQTPEVLHDAPLHDRKTADFHFDDFAATLARLIASTETETPLAIGINGAWGSGKTSLLLRVQDMLDRPKGKDGKGAHRFAEGEEQKFRACKTVWFDAWKYNEEAELLVALVRVILHAMKRDGFINKLKAWMEDPAQPSYDVLAMLLNSFEISFGGLGAEFKLKPDPKKHEEPSPFKQHTAFFDYFNEAFERLLAVWVHGKGNYEEINEKKGALVIFIDDLDRCLPDKTVQTLEALKLFFDKSGCVFVLGADISIVQKAVAKHYEDAGITGESAKDYLEKVIQLRFDLPLILDDAMEKYLRAEAKVDEYMLARWRALVAAAERNPRRVKNVVNDLNLQWYMARNSGQADEVNRDDFICWHALMRAAPESFVEQINKLGEFPEIRHDFVLKAVKWQQGTEDEKKEAEGQYAAYKDFKRLRDVLKRISFSAGFTPEALDAMIYMSAPPPKPEPEPVVEEQKKAAEVVSGEVFAEAAEVVTRGERGKIAVPTDRNRIVVGGLEFLRIPAGKFVMGSKDDSEWSDEEKPQHGVELSEYWMARFILTNQYFAEFVKATSYRTTAEEKGSGYTYDGKSWNDVKGADWKHPLGPKSDLKDREDHPVVLVSWDDAMAYCKWFNETYQGELKEAGNFVLRLPAEAEWEKAARGAFGNEWPWGNEFDKAKCNSYEGGKKGTTPVGAYSSLGGDSPYGCADMIGNVWEWCADWFDEAEYKKRAGGSVVDPRGPQSGTYRVLRGGSFLNDRYYARCAFRDWNNPNYRNYNSGFRVCVSPS